MDFWERLMYYCPRPIKRRRHFFETLAISLHLPIPRIRQMPKLLSSLRTLGSFIISVVSFYSAVSILSWLVEGTLLDIGDVVRAVLNPFAFLLSSLIFGIFWAGIDSLLREMSKRRGKTLSLVLCLLILIPTGFTAGLNSGAFDSVTLLNGSVIDLASCTARLIIKNSGPTHIQISRIEVGPLVCSLPDSGPESGWYRSLDLGNGLGPGETCSIGINYARRSLSTGAGEVEYHSNMEVTPSTFAEGMCPVIIYAGSLFIHRFEVEAKFLEPEKILGVQGYVVNLDYPTFNVILEPNITSSSIAYVYSIDVANVTLKFGNEPIYIAGEWNDIWMSFTPHGVEVNLPHSMDTVNASLSPPKLPVFTVGETYSMNIRTMTNRNYTTSITLKARH